MTQDSASSSIATVGVSPVASLASSRSPRACDRTLRRRTRRERVAASPCSGPCRRSPTNLDVIRAASIGMSGSVMVFIASVVVFRRATVSSLAPRSSALVVGFDVAQLPQARVAEDLRSTAASDVAALWSLAAASLLAASSADGPSSTQLSFSSRCDRRCVAYSVAELAARELSGRRSVRATSTTERSLRQIATYQLPAHFRLPCSGWGSGGCTWSSERRWCRCSSCRS